MEELTKKEKEILGLLLSFMQGLASNDTLEVYGIDSNDIFTIACKIGVEDYL